MRNDLNIIQQILDGKIDHYSILMEKYHNEMFSFVFNMVGNYEDTEDLTQEIFIKTYNSLSKFNPKKSSFRTWLYRIASNHTINFLKSAHKKYSSSNELNIELLTNEDNLEDNVVKEEDLNTVIHYIEELLSEKHKKIMYLHYFSGLTVNEISETLQIPIKTIYKAIKSSIEKIKKEVT